MSESGYKVYFKRGEHKAFELFVADTEPLPITEDTNEIDIAIAIACIKFVKAAFKISTVVVVGDDDVED